MKAIIIRQPWIELILSGQKTWEMRSNPWSHRGPVALIMKGTRDVVGYADVIGMGPKQSPAQMLETFEHHMVSEAVTLTAEGSKWVYPWHLANVIRLARPVRVSRKSGPIVHAILSAEDGAAVLREVDLARAA